MQVAFQGEPGAYSEAAALEHFGPDTNTVPCESFDEVFEQVSDHHCDMGLVPIENSLAGSIHQNYDLLIQNKLSIVGERYLRVRHCLISQPGTAISDIKKVISHPQGLAQCKAYIKQLPNVKTEAVYDTAGSVKMIRDQNLQGVAAIASRRAAEFYQMSILAEGIEDNSANYTRFLAISPEPVFPTTDAKTSIVFNIKNQPGSLFKSLSVFALRDIDLTKMESRPLMGKLWEYLFYIDIIGCVNDESVKRALDHLGEYAQMLRVLGSYPRHHISL